MPLAGSRSTSSPAPSQSPPNLRSRLTNIILNTEADMTTITDLTKDDDVRQLAHKSDILAGHEIWNYGQTGLGTVRPDEFIDAIVQAPNTQTRKTRFELKDGKLS